MPTAAFTSRLRNSTDNDQLSHTWSLSVTENKSFLDYLAWSIVVVFQRLSFDETNIVGPVRIIYTTHMSSCTAQLSLWHCHSCNVRTVDASGRRCARSACLVLQHNVCTNVLAATIYQLDARVQLLNPRYIHQHRVSTASVKFRLVASTGYHQIDGSNLHDGSSVTQAALTLHTPCMLCCRCTTS